MTVTEDASAAVDTPTPVPLDPELAAMIPVLRTVLPEFTLTAETIPQLRETMTLFRDQTDALIASLPVEVEERTIPGPAGAPDLTVSIARPRQRPAAPAPCVYFIHGGGMVMGDRYTGIPVDLVVRFGVTAVSVEYRLAPEHPDPAPVEDCYAGLVWVAEHAAELGIDPDRIMVNGQSAGGGLAAGVTLLARDRGGPSLAGSALVCPMLDDRDRTVSTRQHEKAVVWDRRSNRTGWAALLGERVGGPDVSPYAAPARAADLSGLPPTFLDVGSAEVFRDEIVEYASRIWAAGGSAELHVWAGAFHGSDRMLPTAAVSDAAQQARAAWIARTLGV